MRSRMVQQRHGERFDTMVERANGQVPSMTSFSFGRASAINIADISQIPLAQNSNELQDADGNFYFLFGHSQIGGPDILR